MPLTMHKRLPMHKSLSYVYKPLRMLNMLMPLSCVYKPLSYVYKPLRMLNMLMPLRMHKPLTMHKPLSHVYKPLRMLNMLMPLKGVCGNGTTSVAK